MATELTGLKDAAQVTASGQRLAAVIHDVRLREQPNLPTRNGLTAEAWRSDWGLGGPLQQILVVHLRPAAISAWHRHQRQTDHIYCIHGALRLVMFDGRPDSPSQGVVDVRLLHPARPQLIVVPPGIWHGLQNLDPAREACFLNGFDRAYQHDDPDEFRLPLDTDQIPYRF